MKHISRNTSFNLECNMTTAFGDKLLGQYPYDEELAGPEGMHFHVWVPEGTTQETLKEIRSHLYATRDVVSMSYDYLPKTKEVKAKRTLPASVSSLQTIVNEGSMKVLKWPDGTTQAIDLFTAGVMLKVYEAVNEENSAKFERMVAASPGKFIRIAEVCFKSVNRK